MKDLVQNLKVIILSTIVVLGINVIYGAWTDPTANPTGGNTEAPINVSSVSQTKQGGLNVSGPLWADGGLYSQYNTYLAGSLRINNGSQGTGKVLTSDADGFVSWQSNTSSSDSFIPNNIQTFTSSGTGTWTKPQGVSRVYVKVLGGGGGGGGSFVATNNKGGYAPTAGGPGGAGGYSEGYITVTGDVAVTIGAGGTRGKNGSWAHSNYGGSWATAGGTGGTSSFGSIIAYGGTGGEGANSGQTSNGGEGGNASGGQINIKSSNGDDGIKSILSIYGDGGRGDKLNSCANSCSDAKIGTDGKPGLVIVYY